MPGEKVLKMTPPSIQKFDLNKTGQLILIVTTSDMMKEYLIKQKILPEHIDIQGYTSTALKMKVIAMLIGGALANAPAFTGSS